MPFWYILLLGGSELFYLVKLAFREKKKKRKEIVQDSETVDYILVFTQSHDKQWKMEMHPVVLVLVRRCAT